MSVPTQTSIVFLDRDGTVNVDYGYIKDPNNIELIQGSADAVATLNRAGYVVVIISNQSAIGRGMATHEEVQECNAQLERLLYTKNSGAIVDMIVYNPDTPDNATDMRKPCVGMLREIKKYWDFDPTKCWVVGDKISDIEFGINAGIPETHCVLVMTGQGEKAVSGLSLELKQNIQIAKDLSEAAKIIVP